MLPPFNDQETDSWGLTYKPDNLSASYRQHMNTYTRLRRTFGLTNDVLMWGISGLCLVSNFFAIAYVGPVILVAIMIKHHRTVLHCQNTLDEQVQNNLKDNRATTTTACDLTDERRGGPSLRQTEQAQVTTDKESLDTLTDFQWSLLAISFFALVPPLVLAVYFKNFVCVIASGGILINSVIMAAHEIKTKAWYETENINTREENDVTQPLKNNMLKNLVYCDEQLSQSGNHNPTIS